MGLFKSKDERRMEREMAVRKGVRSLERSIGEQGKFTEQFIKQAQQAKRIGDEQQYQFIRGSLKKTATIKRMLERQLVAIQSAMIVQKQAQASATFAESMTDDGPRDRPDVRRSRSQRRRSCSGSGPSHQAELDGGADGPVPRHDGAVRRRRDRRRRERRPSATPRSTA